MTYAGGAAVPVDIRHPGAVVDREKGASFTFRAWCYSAEGDEGKHLAFSHCGMPFRTRSTGTGRV